MRTVDRLIEYVTTAEWLGSPTERRVIVNRLQEAPTREELDRARDELYGGQEPTP